MNRTIEVIIDADEKYPHYSLIAKKQIDKCCNYMIKTRGITNLPILLYKKFMKAQSEYEAAEEILELWLEKNPQATRYTREK